MIPLFPEFKKLELDDGKKIENITAQYPPYSDYNFVSLWSYNIKNDIMVSQLHQNLILRLRDYISDEQFYSFLGYNMTRETIEALLKQAEKENIVNKLKLIPEEVILNNPTLFNFFRITDDRDNFDYILSANETSKLTGNNYRAKRNFVNRFTKKYSGANATIFDIRKPELQKQITELFLVWQKQGQKTRSETEHESIAIQRLLGSVEFLNLIPLGVFENDKLIAFSINEIVHDGFGLIHFEKADESYVGIYQYLKKMTALCLQKLGCVYINYEQDLGIPGLRKAKESWQPIRYLKKYIISPKE